MMNIIIWKKRFILIVLMFINLIFLTSCWDYVEMDKRGYVLAVAIDKANLHNTEGPLEDMMREMPTNKLYAYTIQIPIISRAQSKPSGQGGGGSSQKVRAWNVRIIGNSFFEVNREFSTRVEYPPFYEHLQAVVIGEEVAREGITAPLDFLLRDAEMRRRTRIFVTPQDASTILDTSPKIDDYAGIYLQKLPLNATRNSRILHKTDIGEVSHRLHADMDFVLPKVIASNEEIKDAGCGVFKKNKMVGWLDEIQTNYLKWIANVVQGGNVTVYPYGNSEESVTLEYKDVKTKVRPIVKDGHITMNIESKATMDIAELFFQEVEDVFNEEFVRNMERIAEKHIESEIKNTIEFVQSEYGADIFFFDVAMERYAPKEWDKVKDNWDEIFPTISSNVEVKINIQKRGLMK